MTDEPDILARIKVALDRPCDLDKRSYDLLFDAEREIERLQAIIRMINHGLIQDVMSGHD